MLAAQIRRVWLLVLPSRRQG